MAHTEQNPRRRRPAAARAAAARALVLEADDLVAERARRLLAAEGFAVCTVTDQALYRDLARALAFDLHVIGVRSAADLEGLHAGRPLVLLAPLSNPRAAVQFRMTRPEATLVDRELRDPGALRAALAGPSPGAAGAPAPDPVRRSFEAFGLSERQLEVLARALLGEPSGEIARRLFISEPTVRNHLHAIYARIGVGGRRELLGRFVRGLLEGSG